MLPSTSMRSPLERCLAAGLVPAGVYRARVKAVSHCQGVGNGKAVKLTLVITEGPHEGRRLWRDFPLGEKATPQTRRTLRSLGIMYPECMDGPLPDRLCVKARVNLIRSDVSARNTVGLLLPVPEPSIGDSQ